jgi:hypothetical protein
MQILDAVIGWCGASHRLTLLCYVFPKEGTSRQRRQMLRATRSSWRPHRHREHTGSGYARHFDQLVAEEGKGLFELGDTFFQDFKISVDTVVPDPYYCIVGRG